MVPGTCCEEVKKLGVKDLARMLDNQEYQECLDKAESLLLVGELAVDEQAVVYHAICRSRISFQDYFGAAEAGRSAVEAARRAAAYDTLGRALLDLGVAQVHIRKYETAVETFSNYLLCRAQYDQALQHEGKVLFNLGVTFRRLDRYDEALHYALAARHWYVQHGDLPSADEARRSAVATLLLAGRLDQAEPLLAEGDAYQHGEDDRPAMLEHMLQRAELALYRGDHSRSIEMAFAALEAAEGNLALQSRSHIMLCQNALAMERWKDALGFALAARVAAIDGRFYDLEFEASHLMFGLLHSQGFDLLRELDREYFAIGLDICHYISESAYRRHTRSN